MKKWIVTFTKEYFDVNFVLNFKNQRKMSLRHALPIKDLNPKHQNKKTTTYEGQRV